MNAVCAQPQLLPCQRVEPELFFSDLPDQIQLAKALCQECAMRATCLENALRNEEPHGVWGGELFAEGVIIEQRRGRGRPRKHPKPNRLQVLELPLADLLEMAESLTRESAA